jgi:hypothetical protein
MTSSNADGDQRDLTGRREPQAFMSANTELEAAQTIDYFVRRWQIEVTFAPRSLQSRDAVRGDVLSQTTRPYAAAWYRKTDLPFTHAIGAVLLVLWSDDLYPRRTRKMHQIPQSDSSAWRRRIASPHNVQNQAKLSEREKRPYEEGSLLMDDSLLPLDKYQQE